MTAGPTESPEIASLSHRLTGVEIQTHRVSEAQVRCNQAVQTVRENTEELTKVQSEEIKKLEAVMTQIEEWNKEDWQQERQTTTRGERFDEGHTLPKQANRAEPRV